MGSFVASVLSGTVFLLGVVPSPAAFGFAEVVKDRFTGEPRWDIEYKQVDGHNREEVVSAILTCQTGGVIPGLIPQKPTSLIMHK